MIQPGRAPRGYDQHNITTGVASQMQTKEPVAGPSAAPVKPQGLLTRRAQQPWIRKSRSRDLLCLSGAIAVAIALSVLLATSNHVISLDTQGV